MCTVRTVGEWKQHILFDVDESPFQKTISTP